MVDVADNEAMWISQVVVADDRQAYARLVRLHQGTVRRFLCGLCRGDAADADDLAQEVFWKAYRHLGSFRGDGSFVGWLLRIAWQAYVNQQRKRKGVTYEPWQEDQTEAPCREDDLGQQRYDAEQLLGLLRSGERAALLLHYRQGFTHAEVAKLLDLPLGTAKTLIRRALLKMRLAANGPITTEAP